MEKHMHDGGRGSEAAKHHKCFQHFNVSKCSAKAKISTTVVKTDLNSPSHDVWFYDDPRNSCQFRNSTKSLKNFQSTWHKFSKVQCSPRKQNSHSLEHHSNTRFRLYKCQCQPKQNVVLPVHVHVVRKQLSSECDLRTCFHTLQTDVVDCCIAYHN